MKIEITNGENNPVTDFFSPTSNTPETDAFLRDLNDYSDVELRAMTEHARKLEQERDEWRKAAFEITGQATKSRKDLERERDEARDQLIHLRSCVYDVIHSLKAGAFDELEKAWKEGLK
jgi:replicative superfamily II helicase